MFYCMFYFTCDRSLIDCVASVQLPGATQDGRLRQRSSLLRRLPVPVEEATPDVSGSGVPDVPHRRALPAGPRSRRRAAEAAGQVSLRA